MVTGVHIYVDNTIDYTVMHARKPCRHKYDMGTYIFQSDVRTGRTTSWLMYVGNTGILRTFQRDASTENSGDAEVYEMHYGENVVI